MTREAMLQSIEMLAVCFRSHSGSPIDNDVRDKKAIDVAAVRADIEALFAERDAEIERRKHAAAIFDAESAEHAKSRMALRDLRAAVLAVAENLAHRGDSDAADVLRKACGDEA